MKAHFKKHWFVLVMLATMVGFTGYRSMFCPSGSCGVLIPMTESVVHPEAESFPCPDFDLTCLEGNSWKKDELMGKVYLINFWKVGCTPCIQEFPVLNAVQSEFADKEFLVISAALDSDSGKVGRVSEQSKLQAHVVPGTSKLFAQLTAFSGVPATFLVDAQGQVVRSYRGMMNPDSVKKHVAELL